MTQIKKVFVDVKSYRAIAISKKLIEMSISFAIDPLPFDDYRITVKFETDYLLRRILSEI